MAFNFGDLQVHNNIAIIQRFQSNLLHIFTNAPWFLINECMYNDLIISMIAKEVRQRDCRYKKLEIHPNFF